MSVNILMKETLPCPVNVLCLSFRCLYSSFYSASPDDFTVLFKDVKRTMVNITCVLNMLEHAEFKLKLHHTPQDVESILTQSQRE